MIIFVIEVGRLARMTPTKPGSGSSGTALPGAKQQSERLAPIVFSTEAVEPRHRLELWRSTYASFNTLRLLDPMPEVFKGHNEIWPFGGMALLRNSAPAMAFERDSRHVRRDSIDHWAIRVTRRGQSRMRIGDTVLGIGPGLPVLFTLGQPHQGDRTDTDWISLYIPRDSFPELSAGLGRLGNRILDTPGARLLVDYMLMLEWRMHQTTLAELPALAEGTRAMIAACLLRETGGHSPAPREAEATCLERIRGLIRRNIGSATLGPERLCRLAGVSRSQLYRLFEPHGGVARYIQAQRLRLAHAMLEDPACRLTVAAIAERVGHFDASAFTRAFRQAFGYTPSEVRAAALAGMGLTAAAAGALLPGVADFVGVLRQIGVAPEPLRPAA
jgi:AraC-like DNA-binding protein